MGETNGGLLKEWNFDKVISVATHSVRYMAKLGQITFEETMVLGDKSTEKEKIVCVKEPEIPKVSFQDLSINIQLMIFSYLDVKTLCRISLTCKYWCMLAEDDVLWSRYLKSDIHKWKRISNTTYPPTYLEAHSELSPKQIYSRCHQNSLTTTMSKSQPKSSVVDRIFQNLPIFRSVFLRQPLNVVMFGPGLESDTKSLIQKLLWDKTSPFQVTGMFPGLFEGVGSGICLQLKDGNVVLNLITLYASTRAERENNALQNGNRVSKLLADRDKDDSNEIPEQAEVSHSVKELCRTVDAFIYVVDSSIEAQKVKSGNKELHAMMNVNWTAATVPLLVMSCVATDGTLSESCAKVTEFLQMNRLSRPWMVHSMCVESMEGFLDGFMWLVQKAHAY